MKKPIIIALLLLLAALCACSAPASKTGALQTEEKPQDDPVKPSASAAPPALQAKYMNEPPALKVSCGDKEITVGPSSYEWTVVLPDGTARTTAACGMHPLEDRFMHKTLYIADVYDENAVISLSFEAAPEKVSLSAWSESEVGDTSRSPESVQVDGMTFSLPPGVFILEADASFGEKGSAQYAFRVDRTPPPGGRSPAPGVIPPYVPPDTASR